VLVTGASRGLGRAFSQELSASLNPGSVIYLTARSKAKLDETAASITDKSGNLQVRTFEIDHETAGIDVYHDMMKSLNEGAVVSNGAFESAVIIHNAGSIGGQNGLTIVRDFQDKDEIDKYCSLNYTSPAILNSAFMKHFKSGDVISPKMTVINISSLCGVQPWQTYGHYCAIKAARNMLFKVMALEEEESVKVLNYAPGPVDTQLVHSVMADPNLHPSIRDGYRKMMDEKTILKPEQSAKKLVQVLNENKFESGQHVDYYDDL